MFCFRCVAASLVAGAAYLSCCVAAPLFPLCVLSPRPPLFCWVAAAMSFWCVGWGWWRHRCPPHCALSPTRAPLSSVGRVTSPGRHNRSFSVLGAPRHQGATTKGGLQGLCPQPEGPPKPFLRCSFFLYLLWGAPRPQGATIRHHVHCSPCRRPCRLHVGSPGRYT